MIELYNDSKNRVFTLNLDIEGYEPKDVEIKMFIQFKKHKRIYVFFAEYNKTDNNYIIDIPTLEEIDQDSGKLQIEVIAGDMFYKAHEDEFTVDVKKKVEVKKINSTVNEKPKAKIDFSLQREDEDGEEEVLVDDEEDTDEKHEFNYKEETDEDGEEIDDMINFGEDEEDEENTEEEDEDEEDEDEVEDDSNKLNEKIDKIFDKTFKKKETKKLNETKEYSSLIKKFSNFK